MLISPLEAIQQGWIQFPDWMTEDQRQKCIQPNAIDITADKFFGLLIGIEPARLSETEKSFHKLRECTPDSNGFVRLHGGGAFDIQSDFYVKIPTGVAAELIIRSTLNRMGLALNAGLWDSGFEGNLGAIIHNRVGDVLMAPHTRVCQIKFYRSDSVGLYAGGYNTEKGQHWSSTQSSKE